MFRPRITDRGRNMEECQCRHENDCTSRPSVATRKANQPHGG